MHRAARLFLIAIALLLTAGSALADFEPPDPCAVYENPVGTKAPIVEYSLQNFNNSSSFDILALVVSDPGGSGPGTTNPGWTAQALDATNWYQPMGGIAGNDTWATYTGKAFADVFAPSDACVGYFLDYTISADKFITPPNPCLPGQTLGGFYRDGMPDSTFLAVGPQDLATYTGSASDPDFDTFVGTPIIGSPVPLPGSARIVAALLVVLGMAPVGRVRRWCGKIRPASMHG